MVVHDGIDQKPGASTGRLPHDTWEAHHVTPGRLFQSAWERLPFETS